MPSAAAAMFSKKGIAFSKSYLVVECDPADLCACEYGHPACAQNKKGPCMVELAALIKGSSKPKSVEFSVDATKLGPGVMAYVLGAA